MTRRITVKRTARGRLETWANVSRTQPDEETYGLGLGGVGSRVGGDSAARGDRDVAVVESATGPRRVEVGDAAGEPSQEG